MSTQDQIDCWRGVQRLAQIIDDHLLEQALVQTGCEYTRMDECGVSLANMNIVVTQLARRILEFLDETR